MNNYLKLKTMSPFTYSYIFLDCDEYLADHDATFMRLKRDYMGKKKKNK